MVVAVNKCSRVYVVFSRAINLNTVVMMFG